MQSSIFFTILLLLNLTLVAIGHTNHDHNHNENSASMERTNGRQSNDFDDDHHDPTTTPTTVVENSNTTRTPFMSTARDVLIRFLFKNYDKKNFPSNASVSFEYTLMDINYDETTKHLEIDAWLSMEWTDPRLQWDPSDFGGEKILNIFETEVWKPDVALYNGRDPKRTYRCMEHNVVIKNTGKVHWVSDCFMVPRCRLNFSKSPFAIQNCTLKFGSWTFDGPSLDLQLKKEKVDLQSYEGGDWEFVGDQLLTRNSKQYKGHPAPFLDIRVNLVFKKKNVNHVPLPVTSPSGEEDNSEGNQVMAERQH